MNDATTGLAARLASTGTVTLTDDERALIVAALGALGAAESRLALHEKLLESYGDDARALLGQADDTLRASMERLGQGGPIGIDPEAHSRARSLLRERLEASATASEWIGAVLDIARLVIG